MQIRVEHGSCLGTIYHNGKAKIMVIDNVLVEEGYREKGIGTLLMENAIKIAILENVDCVELLVNTENKEAKGLYKKVGFKKTNKEHYRLILNYFKWKLYFIAVATERIQTLNKGLLKAFLR